MIEGEELLIRWEKARVRGVRYALKDRRTRGAKKRRPIIKKISTVQARPYAPCEAESWSC